MKEARLLRCIGEIDNELILGADTVRFPPRRLGHWLALAACIALVISVPFLLPGKQNSPNEPGEEYHGTPLSPYLVPDEGILLHQYTENSWEATVIPKAAAEPLAELMYEGEDVTLDEVPASVPSFVLDFRNGTYVMLYGLDTVEIKSYETGADWDYDVPPPVYAEDTPDQEPAWVLRRRIPGLDEALELAFTQSETVNLGGLRLGMTMEEVRAILGEPEQAPGGGSAYWLYQNQDLRIEWFEDRLATIFIKGDCALQLNSGIGLGSTAEAVAAAYPDHIIGNSVDALNYHISQDDGCLIIETQNDIVTQIILYGPEETAEAPEGIGTYYNESLGELTLGMSAIDVGHILGEALSQSENLLEYTGLRIGINKFGRVRAIHAEAGCTLTLSTGIGIGSTEADFLNTYPGCIPGEMGDGRTSYLSEGEQQLLAVMEDGLVAELDLIDQRDPLLEALTSNQVAIYTYDGKVWPCTIAIDKAAKRICTVMTISGPELAEEPDTEPIAWLDFGTGAAVALYDGDYAKVYSVGFYTFSPVESHVTKLYQEGIYLGLCDAVAQAMENPTETWDASESAPLGTPEEEAEAPAEEPG